MRLAIPDLVSPSYFPAAVMLDQGFTAAQGADLTMDQLWPIEQAVDELHDGRLEFLAAPAHVVPRVGSGSWGTPLIAGTISRGTFWFLVARPSLGLDRDDLAGLSGLNVAAAPGPDLAFRMLLRDAGVDPEKLNIGIGLPEGIPRSKDMSFGAWAARELERGSIDLFWANGMGAELAVRSGAGVVVLDVRRGHGPPQAFDYTFAAILVSGELARDDPDTVRAVVRAMGATQEALRADPSVAQASADRLFSSEEAALLVELIRRDVPYYQAGIDAAAVAGMSRFLMAIGELSNPLVYGDIVFDAQP